MAKHARVQTAEQQERLARNRKTLLEALSGAAKADGGSIQSSGLFLALERFAVNATNGETVSYEGGYGIESLLHELAKTYQGGESYLDGHLVGLHGILAIDGAEAPIEIKVTLGIGAQLRLLVGPSPSIATLLDAVRVFDRHFHLACVARGVDYELMARGCNPWPDSPSDIVPVPLSRNVFVNAYFSRTGRYAREAMRCTAETDVLLPIASSEEQAVEDYRLAVALAPILAFATDNSLTMRHADPQQTPRMLRALVCRDLDTTRTGIVRGTFRADFGFQAYESWLEQTRAIFFSSDEGVTFSTGTDTCERVMEDRDLSAREAQQFLEMVFPDVRWNGCLELRAADSLPLHLAGAYAALIKGLFANEQTRAAVSELVSLSRIDEDAVELAWYALREEGWAARVYERPASQVIHELSAIAARALESREERRLLDGLAQLWEVRYVPRDTLLRNWDRTREKSSEEVAVELYGEGAVIPYDELGGEPPAGKTTALPVIRDVDDLGDTRA